MELFSFGYNYIKLQGLSNFPIQEFIEKKASLQSLLKRTDPAVSFRKNLDKEPRSIMIDFVKIRT